MGYGYLLSAYNTEIYSTQQWAQKHPNDFNANNSLQGKSFLMKMLLKKWKKEEHEKYKLHKDINIKFRLISIGDSFFEFLSCYNIGWDFVNRIKLLEEPTVDQMINLWAKILYLSQDEVYDANVVFVTDKEYYYMDEERMSALNEQCIDRVNHNKKNVGYAKSLFEIITLNNT